MNIQLKKILLKLAREAIEEELLNKKIEINNIPKELKEKRGVFVTLKKENKLRGCIGFPYPILPLYIATIKAAKAAAFEDPRFPPLQINELPLINIEISVLTTPKKINNINEIEVGKHGLIIKYGPYSGLLLPQVAIEEGWDKETFLGYTCLKAGLPFDCWKKGAEIFTFEAEVFDEKEILQK